MSSAITITGHLLGDARHGWHAASAQWLLSFDFSPPAGPRGKARTYRVAKPYGSGNAAAYACSARANDLRKGVRVVVVAGAEDAAARGVSLLCGVDRIDTPDLTYRNITGEQP
jgi:hypothetical protein